MRKGILIIWNQQKPFETSLIVLVRFASLQPSHTDGAAEFLTCSMTFCLDGRSELAADSSIVVSPNQSRHVDTG